ncbi:MAG TPA: hypothetical protein VM115_04595 [Vicinamibacterales bacterium]|nr:hypothetical protein [Vicinamibacterales bacterium]
MPPTQPTPDSIRPWQFFTLGALVCATVAVFMIRGTSAENLIFVCLAIFAAALVGLAALNMLRPLATGETREPDMVGGQTRAAIEREKNMVLRSIKELEFDRAMGKLDEQDYEQMSARLRSRAVRLMQQLDNTTSGYREIIERELAKRLVNAGTRESYESKESAESMGSVDAGVCKSCATVNDTDAKFCKSCGSKLLAMLLVCLSTFYFSLFTFITPASAQLQMPDPRQMAGIPRPVTDLPSAHVSVRLIRGQLANNIAGHPIEMHAAGKVVSTVKTDENGRAEFSGITPGTTVRAVATVDGERLESQEFPWPADGGIRLMLVATPPGGDAPAPVFQPRPGNVVLGDQTRVIIDHADDGLQVYYLLDIRNNTTTPVNPPSAIVVNMPSGAISPTVLAGAPQAVSLGDHVTITGPFATGQTEVQIAFRLPVTSGDVTFKQTLPLSVPGLAVLMRKVGDISLTSPQLPEVQERAIQGDTYILAQGPAIPSGAPLAITVSGLPHHSPVPRRIALTLAILIIGAGIWTARRRPLPGSNASRIKQLSSKREKLYQELVRLEQQRRAGSIDATKYAERRPALLAQLERVYRDLDAEGGQSAAA